MYIQVLHNFAMVPTIHTYQQDISQTSVMVTKHQNGYQYIISKRYISDISYIKMTD